MLVALFVLDGYLIDTILQFVKQTGFCFSFFARAPWFLRPTSPCPCSCPHDFCSEKPCWQEQAAIASGSRKRLSGPPTTPVGFCSGRGRQFPDPKFLGEPKPLFSRNYLSRPFSCPFAFPCCSFRAERLSFSISARAASIMCLSAISCGLSPNLVSRRPRRDTTGIDVFP